MMADLFEVTDAEKLACAVRETRLRERVYPRLIEKGKMKADRAEREIELMRAIALDYQNKIFEANRESGDAAAQSGDSKDQSVRGIHPI
jgi:hypothetical protein